MNICCVVALTLLLAGCERTVFQSPPAAAGSCDPALVGRWLSQDDKPEDAGELEARISADCTLALTEHKQEGPKQHGPTQLHTARVDGQRYLWIDAAWANRAFEVEANALDQAGDVYLFAYRLQRNELSLASLSERALAHNLLDDKIDGEVLKRKNELTVRVMGDSEAIRKALRHYRVFRFDDESPRFKRATDADATP